MTDHPISDLLAEVYARALADLTVEQLEAACIAVVRSHQAGRLPLPGDILAKVEGVRQDSRQLEAERAWEALQQQISLWTFDDSRGWFYPRHSGGKIEIAPEFSEVIEYAIRQCGGLHAVIYPTIDRFPFLRRDFLGAYVRYTETSGLQMLGKGEARAILAKVRKGLPPTPPPARTLKGPEGLGDRATD